MCAYHERNNLKLRAARRSNASNLATNNVFPEPINLQPATTRTLVRKDLGKQERSVGLHLRQNRHDSVLPLQRAHLVQRSALNGLLARVHVHVQQPAITRTQSHTICQTRSRHHTQRDKASASHATVDCNDSYRSAPDVENPASRTVRRIVSKTVMVVEDSNPGTSSSRKIRPSAEMYASLRLTVF